MTVGEHVAHADGQRSVVVWGNCQAAPIASLLEEPVARRGWKVLTLPPVFEIDEAGLAGVQKHLASAVLLVTQPIRDEYRIPGCGSTQLAALLPDDGRTITIPVIYDSSAFPYQVNAHRGDGARVDAPVTDYHDLRTLVAAERGLSVEQAVAWWPEPDDAMVRENATRSQAELRRRESDLDVTISDQLSEPVMWTLSHPRNTVLAEVAVRILELLDLDTGVTVPSREFVGARRAPIEPAVARALGWPNSAIRPDWIVEHRPVDLPTLLASQLPWYAERPDIAADARVRFADRLALLGLG